VENFTLRRRAIIRDAHPSRARTVLHERVVVGVVVFVSAFRETVTVTTIAKNRCTEDESIGRIVIVITNNG
jgi:hypothetical protein